MPERVFGLIFVGCNCEHPIPDAPIQVEVFRATGARDGSRVGKTNSFGIFMFFYERGGIRPTDLRDMRGFVVACEQKHTFDTQDIRQSVDWERVAERINAARTLPRGVRADELKSQAEHFAGFTSLDLIKYVSVIDVRVNCHENCEDAPDEHNTETFIETSENSGSSIKLTIKLIDGEGSRFTYEIENKRNDDIEDFKVCFNTNPKDLIDEDSITVPDGWNWRFEEEEKCIVFETQIINVNGIPRGESKTISFKTKQRAFLGRVSAHPSYLDVDGDHAYEDEDRHTVDGPIAALIPDDTGTIVITGEIYHGFLDDLTFMLEEKNYNLTKMEKEDLLIVTTKRNPEIYEPVKKKTYTKKPKKIEKKSRE